MLLLVWVLNSVLTLVLVLLLVLVMNVTLVLYLVMLILIQIMILFVALIWVLLFDGNVRLDCELNLGFNLVFV